MWNRKANIVDPDLMAEYEWSHQNLLCLPSGRFRSTWLKGRNFLLFQICHHPGCSQLNENRPLLLCKECDNSIHSRPDSSGHLVLDTPKRKTSKSFYFDISNPSIIRIFNECKVNLDNFGPLCQQLMKRCYCLLELLIIDTFNISILFQCCFCSSTILCRWS